MKTLAIYSIKGGVGKTAAAVNLAWLAANQGYRTLLWDLDPQAAASFYFRIKPKLAGGARRLIRRKRSLEDVIKASDFPGLDLVPADFANRNMDLFLNSAKKSDQILRKILKPVAREYDLLLFDCPPNISLVSENVFRASDTLLVPLIPTTLSVRTYAQLVRHLRESALTELDVLVFFSMVDRRKRLHEQIVTRLQQDRQEVLKAEIPYASEVEKMGLRTAPLMAFAPGGKAGTAFAELWRELESRF